MTLIRQVRNCAALFLFAWTCGCQSTPRRSDYPGISRSNNSAAQARPGSTPRSTPPPIAPAPTATAAKPETHIQQVAFRQAGPGNSAALLPSEGVVIASQGELSLPQLVAEVQARNPSLQAMVAAWQAASQRYPQATSLEDPMFVSMLAPASFGNPDSPSGYILQGGQKFPWFGKLAARGRAARAEASAAYFDVGDTRLRLAEATQLAFFDYYLVRRNLELNAENVQVMRRFRDTADAKYRAGQVTQQDVLQADVELADLERRRLELERLNEIAVARINTLLRSEPTAPLAPPPGRLDLLVDPWSSEALQQVALERRPDLAAIRARLAAEQAAVTLAARDYYPDTTIDGLVNTMMPEEMHGQVGVSMNVPIYRGRLNAAVREATFRVSQRRAEFDQRALDIQFEVQSAYAQVQEARKTVNLYAETFVPTARRNVAAARANYDVGRMTFLELALAQRQLIELLERQQEAMANYHSRRAELQRVIGGPLLESPSGAEEVPAPSPR